MYDRDLYKKVEQFVISSFNKSGQSHQIKHFLRTAYWIKELKPNADDVILIAAVAHDIERAFRLDDVKNSKKTLSFLDLKFLRPHEERGAEIICSFLRDNNADIKLTGRVRNFVSRHEEGGDADQNLLKDADSISFFENNVSQFLTKQKKEVGKEKVKQKFDWMFERITSQRAKKIAQPWYEDAVARLD